MSLVIFFGFSACVFLMGLLVIGVTVYQWIQEGQRKKLLEKQTAK
jgi:hypothetical protein